jgi:hypothetical protein
MEEGCTPFMCPPPPSASPCEVDVGALPVTRLLPSPKLLPKRARGVPAVPSLEDMVVADTLDSIPIAVTRGTAAASIRRAQGRVPLPLDASMFSNLPLSTSESAGSRTLALNSRVVG